LARPHSIPADPGGFFSHHGLMAPAVRLFRSQSFSMRALLISLVFLVPILVLSSVVVQEKRGLVASSGKELEGVRYLQAVYPVVGTGTALMMSSLQGSPADRAAARSKLDTALKALAAIQSAQPAIEGTAEPYAELDKSLKAADAAAHGMPSFVLYARFLDQVMHLMAAASDGSGLTLDSDLVLYHLTGYVTKDLPRLNVRTAQVAAAGLAAIDAKAASPLLQRVFSDNEVLISLYFADLKASLGKVQASAPELTAVLQGDRVFTDSQALYKLIEDGIADSTDITLERGRFAQAVERALQSQQGLATTSLVQADDLLHQRIDQLNRSMWFMALGIVAQFGLAFYLFYAFYLVTIGGMRKTAEHLMAITEGDLTTTPRPWGKDEAARLMLTLNDMQTSVREVVQHVRDSSEHIVSAVGEVAAGANDLAQRTAQGAANVESTVSAMNEISDGIQQTSQSADQAARIASDNSSVAEKGHQVIGSVINTMDEIQTSSRRINDIIGVIDGIAFQTNILALNAAVEAARAGEQGRGFAVVASEVRALAKRSSDAAREIKQLITVSVSCVEAGTKVVQGAGETMQEIVVNASTLRDLLEKIAVAARDQARLVAEVEGTMHDLDGATQQNAALVEQSAASADAMRHQAQHLLMQVERFRTH